MREYARHALRIGFVVMLFVSLGLLAQSYVSADEVSKAQELRQQAELPAGERTAVAEPRDGTTVITTQQREHAARAPGELIAIGSDGRLRYYNRSYHSYWDSEAVAGTDATIMYVAAVRVETGRCSRLEDGAGGTSSRR